MTNKKVDHSKPYGIPNADTIELGREVVGLMNRREPGSGDRTIAMFRADIHRERMVGRVIADDLAELLAVSRTAVVSGERACENARRTIERARAMPQLEVSIKTSPTLPDRKRTQAKLQHIVAA